MFVFDFTDSALEDLDYFRKYEQQVIIDGIDRQLRYEPAVHTRQRKPLAPNALGSWEVRIGVYRVFYDIDSAGASVKINAIGEKVHNRLFIRGKEYIL